MDRETSRRKLLALGAGLLALAGSSLGTLHEGHAKKNKKGKKKHKNKGGKGQGKGAGGGSGNYAPDSEERAFLDLINDYRKSNGLGALTLNNQLGAAAEYHSSDMAKKNYFKHTLANGDSSEQNIVRFGYTSYTAVGENIAAGYASAGEAMQAWKKSSEHDHNMRNSRYSEIGIGRAYSKSSKFGWYWTTTFGDRG